MKFQDDISMPIHTYGKAEINMSPLFQSWGHKKVGWVSGYGRGVGLGGRVGGLGPVGVGVQGGCEPMIEVIIKMQQKVGS